MKRKILYGLMLSTGLLMMVGCADDVTNGESAVGKVNPVVDVTTAVDDALPQSRAEAMAITASDLKLKLTSANGTFARVWSSVDEFNNNEQFAVGTYTLEAYYGAPNDEGYAKPYYYGSTELAVAENRVTTVNLNVALCNSMVSVAATDAFKAYFSDYAFEVKSSNGSALAYDLDEPIYVTPGEVTLYASVTTQDGKSVKLAAATFRADAKKHYNVTVNVNNGTASAALLEITFSDEINGTETIEIELSDELFTTEAPVLTVEGYDASTNYLYIEGSKPEELNPVITLLTPGQFRSVKMAVESDYLASLGLGQEVELVDMTAGNKAKLAALGYKQRNLTANGRLGVIELGEMLNNIRYVEGGSNTTTLAFQTTDKLGKVSDPVTVIVTISKVSGAVEAIYNSELGSSEAQILVSYNGSDIENDVKVQRYASEAGVWRNVNYTVASKSRSESTNYTLNLTGLPTIGEVQLRLLVADVVVTTFTIKHTGFMVQASNNDVFATYALVKLYSEDEMDFAKVSFKANGTSVASTYLGDGVHKVTGLAPASEVTLTAVSGTQERSVKVNTEAVAQLPNGNMDSWTEVKGHGSSFNSYWSEFYPGESVESAVWGTNNLMTTSQGAGYAYTRISGTISTNGRSGKAALIRSVGWGSGNTAVGSGGGSGKTKYTDAGLLHLGSNRTQRPVGYSESDGREGALTTTDLDCGISFTSRPQSLSFWYKYAPKNSADMGYAEIEVYDASGAVIATGKTNLAKADDFTEATIALTYAANAPKAGKIYVKFLSTYDRNFLAKSDNNFSGPGFANTSNGTYMGSQLTVDDITLNY